MKIVRVETFPVEIPIVPEKRIISALGEHSLSRYVLVRLTTDTGLSGVGEATVMPRWSGETVWGAVAVIDKLLGPLLIGQDPREILQIEQLMDRFCIHNWFAKSALEMACWDIAGKAVGKPVYELLGGAVRPRTVICRFSMGAYDVDRARRRATELVAEGFTTIKVKVGGQAEADIARVRAVREAIGPDRQLTIDANTGWDVDTAIHCINALKDCRLALAEQPTADGDYAAIARVKRETGIPIMADDMCFNLVHARELVRNQACDLISVYPGKQGGIRKTKQLVEYARANGIACSIGSNLELDVATAAMAHTVIACPNIRVEEFPGDMLGPIYHEVRVVKNPISIEGPRVTLEDRPGLGVEIDWDVVHEYRLKS